MSEEEVASAIAKTQELLQPLISRPQLKDKLLSKPPFRFIHDVFMALISENGFATGLYGDDETNSANIKDKSAKLAFLDKMITCVGIVLGRELDVRSAKIVAGLEPENTNLMLAELARVASNPDTDGAAAVERTLAGEKPDASRPALKGAGAKDEGAKGDAPAAADAKGDSRAEEKADDAPAKDDAPPAAAKPSEGVPASRGGVRGDKEEVGPKSGGMGPGFATSAGDLDEEIERCTGDASTTIDMLQPLITKPKLTEKLLAKPPFRFLHDVVMAVLGATGFGEGLYDETELDSAAVKEKAAKVAFLEKTVKLVGVQLNTYTAEIRPAKIVSGLEPENTNRLLQLLALAATKMPDSSNAVKLVLSGEDGGAPAAASSAPAPAVAKPDAAPEPAAAPLAKSEPPSRGPSPANDMEPGSAMGGSDAKGGDTLDDDKNDDKGAPPQLGGGAGGADGAKGADGDVGAGAGDELLLHTAEPKRSTRPQTARRRPPKFASNVKEVDNSAAGGAAAGGDAKSAGGAAAAAVPSGIMIDGQATDDQLLNDEDDEENADDVNVNALLKRAAGGTNAAEGKSKLVQDILKEQQDAKNAGAAAEGDDAKKDDKGGIRLGRLKKTGADKNKNFGLTDADLEQLRAAIQVLCQSTNPLGKCMDYVHEDLGLMNRELEKWQSECRKYTDELEGEKEKTEAMLLPLRLQQTEVDEKVKEELAKIASLKAVIHKNDERISELMNMTIGAR